MTTNNEFKGRTKATIEGVKKSLDSIWDRLKDLPCSKQGERLASLEKGQLFLWGLMVLMLGSAGTIIVMLVKK